MSGVFGAITDALSGNSRPSAKTGGKMTATFDGSALARARNNEMCAQGMNPKDYGINYDCDSNTTSGIDAAMQDHANKTHPIGPPPKLRGAR